MIKSYFKNLLTIIIYLISLVALLYAFSFTMSILGITWYNPDYVFGNIIVILILFLISSISIFLQRIRKYKKPQENYKHFILHKIKSSDNFTAVLSWQTLLIPFEIVIATSENTPLLPLIIGTIVLVIASTLIIEITNFIIWSIVYLFSKN